MNFGKNKDFNSQFFRNREPKQERGLEYNNTSYLIAKESVQIKDINEFNFWNCNT